MELLVLLISGRQQPYEPMDGNDLLGLGEE